MDYATLFHPSSLASFESCTAVSLCHKFVRGVEIDACSSKAPVADLLLDDGERNLVEVDVVHEVAVAQRVDGELVELSALLVLSIFPV